MKTIITLEEIRKRLQLPSDCEIIIEGDYFRDPYSKLAYDRPKHGLLAHEIENIIENVQTIQAAHLGGHLIAVKCYRELFKVGLKEAKDAVEVIISSKQ